MKPGVCFVLLLCLAACGGAPTPAPTPCAHATCGTACVDTTTDPSHCGACGHACAAGATCAAGQCVTPTPSCPQGQAQCGEAGDACIDVTSDQRHCGACGTACPAGQACAAGKCGCPAAAPDACGSGAGATCTNTTTDGANCGACGTACGAGQFCIAGKCQSTCPAGTPTACGSGVSAYCANTTGDPANCGACGTVCATGASCAGSACACPSGQSACGGAASSPGVCVPSGQCLSGQLPTACAQLHLLAPSLPSGAYTLDPDGAGPIAPFAAYCDMTSDGGGWTLALKADGGEATAARFKYASSLWSTTTTSDPNYVFNPGSTDLSRVSAKFMSFNALPYTQVRLGMGSTVASVSYVQFSLPGASAYSAGVNGKAAQSSLQATFAGGTPIPLGPTPSRGDWLSLVGGPNLQPNCNLGGLNNSSAGFAQTRVGFLGNNENNCNSPDSYVGLGNDDSTPAVCGDNQPNAYVGNMAGCNINQGGTGADGSTPAFAYLFIRDTDFRAVVPAQPSCAAHLLLGRSISGIYPISYGAVSSAVYCDMTHGGGGWTMAYKFSSGLPKTLDASALWTQTGATNESVPSQLNVLSTLAAPTGPYLGRIVTSDWNSVGGFTVAKTRVVVYNGEAEAQSLQFKIAATSAASTTAWYGVSNLTASTFSDITPATPAGSFNFFSIAGDSAQGGGRRWYISNLHNGCALDKGWLAVTYGNTEGCAWESQYGGPSMVLYSNQPTAQTWLPSGSVNPNVSAATALVIFVQ